VLKRWLKTLAGSISRGVIANYLQCDFTIKEIGARLWALPSISEKCGYSEYWKIGRRKSVSSFAVMLR